MNKKILKITSINENDAPDYWKNKSHLERLEAQEQLRRIIFGYDSLTARLQRILTIAQLKKD